MGFFNKLKSALGYSDSEYDEDDELDGFSPAHRTPYVNPFKKDETMPDLSDLEQPAEAAPTAVAEVNRRQWLRWRRSCPTACSTASSQ